MLSVWAIIQQLCQTITTWKYTVVQFIVYIKLLPRDGDHLNKVMQTHNTHTNKEEKCNKENGLYTKLDVVSIE